MSTLGASLWGIYGKIPRQGGMECPMPLGTVTEVPQALLLLQSWEILVFPPLQGCGWTSHTSAR